MEPWQYDIQQAAAERREQSREARERFGEPISRPAAVSQAAPPTNESLSAREPTATTTGRRILAWRDDPAGKADCRREIEQQALVEGVGWCRYCWRLNAVMVGGKWELC